MVLEDKRERNTTVYQWDCCFEYIRNLGIWRKANQDKLRAFGAKGGSTI